MLFQNRKPANRKGKVLFIDAKNEVERKNAESQLTQEHIDKIASVYREFKSIDRFAYVATNDEIVKNGCNIGIAHYVMADAPADEDLIDASEAVSAWSSDNGETIASVDELGKFF